MITQIWAWLTAPEQWSGSRGIPTRLVEHLGYSALSLGLAAAVALAARDGSLKLAAQLLVYPVTTTDLGRGRGRLVLSLLDLLVGRIVRRGRDGVGRHGAAEQQPRGQRESHGGPDHARAPVDPGAEYREVSAGHRASR